VAVVLAAALGRAMVRVRARVVAEAMAMHWQW
jgi:hypothetical protein